MSRMTPKSDKFINEVANAIDNNSYRIRKVKSIMMLVNGLDVTM